MQNCSGTDTITTNSSSKANSSIGVSSPIGEAPEGTTERPPRQVVESCTWSAGMKNTVAIPTPSSGGIVTEALNAGTAAAGGGDGRDCCGEPFLQLWGRERVTRRQEFEVHVGASVAKFRVKKLSGTTLLHTPQHQQTINMKKTVPVHMESLLRMCSPIRRLLHVIACTGKRIVHYMTCNRTEDVLLRLAAALCGYIPVTVNWDADTLQRILFKMQAADCHAVIVDRAVSLAHLRELHAAAAAAERIATKAKAAAEAHPTGGAATTGALLAAATPPSGDEESTAGHVHAAAAPVSATADTSTAAAISPPQRPFLILSAEALCAPASTSLHAMFTASDACALRLNAREGEIAPAAAAPFTAAAAPSAAAARCAEIISSRSAASVEEPCSAAATLVEVPASAAAREGDDCREIAPSATAASAAVGSPLLPGIAAKPALAVVQARDACTQRTSSFHSLQDAEAAAAAEASNYGAAVESDTPAKEGNRRDISIEREFSFGEPDAERLVVFTSGTTGTPRGAVITNKNLETSCNSFRRILELESPSNKTPLYLILVNPLHHINSSVLLELAFRYPRTRLTLFTKYTTNFWEVLCATAEAAAAADVSSSSSAFSSSSSSDSSASSWILHSSTNSRTRDRSNWRGNYRLVVPLVSRHIDFLQVLVESGRLVSAGGCSRERLSAALRAKEVTLLMGSAPVGENTIKTLQRCLDGKLPLIRFGSTETTLQVAATPRAMKYQEMEAALQQGWQHSCKTNGKQKGFYIGRPCPPFTELRVVKSIEVGHPEYMVDCDEGEAGNLVCRGNNAVKKYVDGSTPAYSADGWFLGLGDVGYYLKSEQDMSARTALSTSVCLSSSTVSSAPSASKSILAESGNGVFTPTQELNFYWVTRSADLIIKGGANYSCAQVADELKTFLLHSYPALSAARATLEVGVVGLKLDSEHEDTCCVTLDIDFPKLSHTDSRDRPGVMQSSTRILEEIQATLLHKAQSVTDGGLSKASKPDKIRFAKIPRNFKGTVDIPTLKKDFLHFLQNNGQHVDNMNGKK